jgi:hypothetical protein
MYDVYHYHLLCVDHITNDAPNWNARENEPGYIENRTHWVDSVINIPEQTITANGGSATLSDLQECTIGHGTFIVTLDGQQYTCQSWGLAEGLVESNVMVGDSRILFPAEMNGHDMHHEDVPFGIHYDVNDSYCSIAFAVSGTHTLKIEYIAPDAYHPLDEKFIPDTIARTADV